MRRSAFIGSAVLHVGVFALAVFGLPFLPERRIEDTPPVVLVDLAPITDVSNAPPPAPQTVEKPPEPKPEPPKQEATPAPPPPPPPPQPVSKPAPPAPPPPPPKVAEPEPAPAPKPLPKPKEVAEVPTPAPPKPVQKPTPPTVNKTEAPKDTKIFDPTQLALLINKMQKPAAPTAPTQPVAAPAPAPAVRAQGPSNPNLPVSQSEKDFLRAQVEKYWNPDLGAKYAGELVVRVTFWINPDGTLKVQPTIVDRSKMGDPYYSAAANNAVRAVLRAEPFKLPPGDTARWNQEIELRFDPKDMLGG